MSTVARITNDKKLELYDEVIEYPTELEGGRNYLPLSRGDLKSYTSYNTDWEISDKTIESVINRENHILNLTLSYDNLFEPIATDEIITFSGFLKVNNEIPEKHPFVDNKLSTHVSSSRTELEYNQDTGYFKATYPKRGYWLIHAQTTLVKGDKISIYKPKVEKGSIATDWTPAPEDLGMDYPNDIQHFSTGFRSNGKILVRELIEGKNFRYSTDKKIYLNKLEEGVDLNG